MATSFNKYYYDIDVQLVNQTDNTIRDINNNFIQLKTTFNYKKNVFPITQIFLSLDFDLYTTIRDNDVLIKINIKKKILDSLTDSENIFSGETYINNELFVIMDKNKMILIPEDNETDMPSINASFSLFSMNHLKINKHVFNSNYINCRLTEIMALMNNINDSMLYIERPTNQSRYEQVLIPPMNGISMIKYLQKYYHMYPDGLRMFFDFNSYYILNSNISNMTPVKDGDYKNVIFDILTETEDKKAMPFNCGYKDVNSDFYYIKTDNDRIEIIDNSLSKEEIFGTKNIILSRDENLNTQRVDYNSGNRNIDKSKVYINQFNNPNIINSLDRINKTQMIFKFNNLDIETFKCNKLFRCNANNKIYNMKVENLIFVFTKDKNTGNCNSQGICYFEEN